MFGSDINHAALAHRNHGGPNALAPDPACKCTAVQSGQSYRDCICLIHGQFFPGFTFSQGNHIFALATQSKLGKIDITVGQMKATNRIRSTELPQQDRRIKTKREDYQ
jgi:hypothetical protein